MPFCTCNSKTTAHDSSCRLNAPAPSIGWTCPSCSRNNAPSVQVCQCSKVEDRGPQRQILTEGPRFATLTEG